MNTKKHTQFHLDLNSKYGAQNYKPLPVVLARGQGHWVWDVEGRRYVDMLSAYSSLNFGHCHPVITKTLADQASVMTLCSRAFYNDIIGPWTEDITKLCHMDRALPMNSGAEAVETAIKMARKWGYLNKNIPENQAQIIVFGNNFHGRTTTIVSFSTDKQYKEHFGPFTPGFVTVPFGDDKALESAMGPHTVAVLLEPIQAEAGVIVPPKGFLTRIRELCTKNKVLMLADEIQTGLGRTGNVFACDAENIKPDAYILGKALGGGCLPISAVVSSDQVMSVFKPGDHGSTFGGNPLACAVSRTAMAVLKEENLVTRSHKLGIHFRQRLSECPKHIVQEVRGWGLLNAIELTPEAGDAHNYCMALMDKGILAKDTHGTVVRFAPPLTIDQDSLESALDVIVKTFSHLVKNGLIKK